MQSEKIGSQPVLCFQVDVEREIVQEVQFEILGGRKIYVCSETVRIDGLHSIIKAAQEILYTPAPMPTYDRCRDLVSDCITKQGRVSGDRFYLFEHAARDFWRPCSAVD